MGKFIIINDAVMKDVNLIIKDSSGVVFVEINNPLWSKLNDLAYVIKDGNINE